MIVKELFERVSFDAMLHLDYTDIMFGTLRKETGIVGEDVKVTLLLNQKKR